jgi:hypothetical protein
MNTFWPAWSRPTSTRPRWAMSPETGTTAACSKVRLVGLAASLSSWAAAYSACEPRRTWYSGHPVLRPAEAEPEDEHQVRLPGHQVPGNAVEAGRADP